MVESDSGRGPDVKTRSSSAKYIGATRTLPPNSQSPDPRPGPEAPTTAAADKPTTSTANGTKSNASATHATTNSDPQPSSARSRRSATYNWKNKDGSPELIPTSNDSNMDKHASLPRPRPSSMPAAPSPPSKSPWAMTIRTLLASLAGLLCLALIILSLNTKQLDPKGCRMAWMHPTYTRLDDFDTEHTHFASKYSLYLYRDGGVDYSAKLSGIPVLFIPGNAGSYRQVRSVASEAATHFHHVVRHDQEALRRGARTLDFFSVDFNEDFTAFHGRTLLDQAEYLNEAIRYILSLYLDPRMSARDSGLPDPTSVIIIGHSMGGVVARTLVTMPNYQSKSINTIITLAAPHARPPVSFDSLMVDTYRKVDDFWRGAYLEPSSNNPLSQVTVISIAGGGLDTIVPSDYASIDSLVPKSHGFTVFTSTIPTVWTSMDHQAIMWCDQLRKVLARALFDIVDIRRPSQTTPLAERMRSFRRRLLTGLEDDAEKTLPATARNILLVLDDVSDGILAQGQRLMLRQLGSGYGTPRAYLLPIPPPESSAGVRLTLLTDQKLDSAGGQGQLEVLLCSILPASQTGQGSGPHFSYKLDLSGDSAGSTRLACKNLAADTILLPHSRRSTNRPFYLDDQPELLPFSYLQYNIDDLAKDYQFLAVVDKSVSQNPGFVVAEFNKHSDSRSVQSGSLSNLLTSGLDVTLPTSRPLLTEIKISSIRSAMLAYNLEVEKHSCDGSQGPELFAPLVRQYLTEPYESKYFVNVGRASVSLHGVAPYVPPPLTPRLDGEDGLSFQFWTDPTCGSNMHIKLRVDILGSMGKLYMRYRTIFACFPLLIVALVLRKQFQLYDDKGVFVPFSQGLDLALGRSIPLVLAGLTIMSLSMGGGRDISAYSVPSPATHHVRHNASTAVSAVAKAVDFYQNDLLTGTRDPFYWFMVPLIGLVCVGACAALNWITLGITELFSSLFGLLKIRFAWRTPHDQQQGGGCKTAFRVCSPRRRFVTTAVLVFIVATFVPYQFAYVVACGVQLTTTVRALRIMSDASPQKTSPASTANNRNFYNYAHSLLVLMLWVLPINFPVLVVWVHNLALHWLTPFTSHRNVAAIIPFMVLVETHTTGKMVPRVTTGPLRHVSGALLAGTAVYAAIYGVSYAYVLHYLVNAFAAWLVIVHSTTAAAAVAGSSNGGGFASFGKRNWSPGALAALFENGYSGDRERRKTP